MTNKNAKTNQINVLLKILTTIFVIQVLANDLLIPELSNKFAKAHNLRTEFQINKFLIINIIENSADKVKQRLKNKKAHLKNGNRDKKPKVKR